MSVAQVPKVAGAALAVIKKLAPQTFTKIMTTLGPNWLTRGLNAANLGWLSSELLHLLGTIEWSDPTDKEALQYFLDVLKTDSVFVEHAAHLFTDENEDGSPDARGAELSDLLAAREKLAESKRLVDVLVRVFGSVHRAREVWTALMRIDAIDWVLAGADE